jgi:hypothetical protein
MPIIRTAGHDRYHSPSSLCSVGRAVPPAWRPQCRQNRHRRAAWRQHRSQLYGLASKLLAVLSMVLGPKMSREGWLRPRCTTILPRRCGHRRLQSHDEHESGPGRVSRSVESPGAIETRTVEDDGDLEVPTVANAACSALYPPNTAVEGLLLHPGRAVGAVGPDASEVTVEHAGPAGDRVRFGAASGRPLTTVSRLWVGSAQEGIG